MSREQIESCYREMYGGMIRKDRETLSKVLDERFVLVHMTGMQQPKESFIRAVEDGTLNYFSAEHQRMEVHMDGANAHLIGQSIVSAAVFGGSRRTWRLQLTLQLVKKNGNWKITEAAASTY